MSLKVGLIVGSARTGSINQKLALAIAKEGVNHLEFVSLAIEDLPMFSQDLEKDLPKSVERFKKEIESLKSFIIVTPEHNRSVPALLKNAIDWGSRPYGKNSWDGKSAAIAGTSPGATGTMSSQLQLRHMLMAVGVQVMARPEVYMQFQDGMIDDKGNITSEKTKGFIRKFVTAATEFFK